MNLSTNTSPSTPTTKPSKKDRQAFSKGTHGTSMVECAILIGVVVMIGITGFKHFGKNLKPKSERPSGKIESLK